MNVERLGTTSAKGGYGGDNHGEMACMEPCWWVMEGYEYGRGIHAYGGYAQVGGGVHGIWGTIDMGSLQKMDTCPTRFLKKKCHIPELLLQIRYMIKEIRSKCGKVGDYKCKRWAWWERLGGDGIHGAKMTSNGRGGLWAWVYAYMHMTRIHMQRHMVEWVFWIGFNQDVISYAQWE